MKKQTKKQHRTIARGKMMMSEKEMMPKKEMGKMKRKMMK